MGFRFKGSLKKGNLEGVYQFSFLEVTIDTWTGYSIHTEHLSECTCHVVVCSGFQTAESFYKVIQKSY